MLEAPWLTQAAPPRRRRRRSCFESELGVTRIEGETVFSTFEMGIPEYPQFPILFQGGVRYRWDGEETYGMLERSSMRDKIVLGLSSAHRSEEGPHVVDEQLGLLHRGEVAAARHVGPVRHVVAPLDPARAGSGITSFG